MTDYVKLTLQCYFEYYYLTKPGSDKLTDELKFQPDEKIRIRWPDGELDKVIVRSRRKSGHYSDMGHDNYVTWTEYYFEYEFKGIKFDVPLNKVAIHKDDLPEPVGSQPMPSGPKRRFK